LRVGRDRLGAGQGFGVRRVHPKVVDDTAVDQFGLGRGHSDDPVAPGEFTARGHGGVTPDGDPQHRQCAERVLPPQLGRLAADEGLVHDDPGPGIRLSAPKASHGSGRIACRHRAIPDLPELDPPLSTIT
jgi:hypothetical protein